MEEVSIDIRLNSNVEEEAGKSTSSIEQMAKASIRAQEETKKSFQLQKQYLAKLRTEYEQVQMKLANIKYPTKEKQELRRTSAELLREIKSEEEGLKVLEKELQKLDKGYGLITTEIRKTKNEMEKLSAAGMKDSDTYRKLEGDLRDLSEAQAIVARTGQEMAKGDRSMQGLTDAVGAFAGAATAAAGAWALMGGSQKDQEEIQTKLQSLMSITIGLQQIQNVLLESSTFKIQTVTKVKRLWGNANMWVAKTLGISNAAAKALTATVTLGLSVALGVLIGWYDKWQTKQKQVKESEDAFNTSVANNIASTLAKFEQLRNSYIALGDDIKAKNKFVRDGQKDFEDLGVAVKNATEADNLFIDNSDAFRQAIIERAKATATMELAVEVYKKAIEKMLAAENRADEVTFGDRVKALFATMGSAATGNPEIYKGEEFAFSASRAMRKEAKQDMEDVDKIIQKYQKYMSHFSQKLEEAGIKVYTNSSKNTDHREKAIANMYKRLQQIAKSNEEDIIAIELAALQEGRAKKLRELEIENEKRKALLEERRKDLEEIAKAGIDTTVQQNNLKKVSDNGDAEYLRKITETNAASDKIITEIENTLEAKQTTRQDQRIASARKEYSDLRHEVELHAKDMEELSAVLIRIGNEEQAEITRIRKEGELERLDLDEQIALRRIQISTKHYNLATEREENLIKTELEFAKQRRNVLTEMQENGADVANDITAVTAQIEDLTRALEDIPTRKFEEMAGGLQRMLGTLSKIGGDIGAVFGSLADSMGNLMSGIKKGANTMDRIGSALAGVMQMADVAIRQSNANRQFMEAWQEANESALQVARMQSIEAEAYKKDNIFGVENPYARAIAGAKQYAKTMYALQDLSRTLAKGHVQVGSRKVVSGRNIIQGAGGGAATGGIIGSIFGPVGTAIGAGIGALVGGIFGGAQKKLVPVFENLGKKYGDIYDKDTFAINPKILQDYDKLDDATKKLVDNWGAVQKKAEEAQAQMRDTFRSLSGDIGNQLSEALKKGIADGDIYTAFDDFETYASNVIYDIGQQMIFAQFFQRSFDELQKRMEASFGDGGDGDIRDDIRWVVGQTKGDVEKYKHAMDAMRKEMERQGLKLPDMNGGRKAEARGIGRMTQDSAERLEGLMTVQVDRLSTLVTYAKQTDDYYRDCRIYYASIIRQIDRIAANSDYLRKLENIAGDLYRLNQDGIYIKR